jgi:hypothetical protein
MGDFRMGDLCKCVGSNKTLIVRGRAEVPRDNLTHVMRVLHAGSRVEYIEIKDYFNWPSRSGGIGFRLPVKDIIKTTLPVGDRVSFELRGMGKCKGTIKKLHYPLIESQDLMYELDIDGPMAGGLVPAMICKKLVKGKRKFKVGDRVSLLGGKGFVTAVYRSDKPSDKPIYEVVLDNKIRAVHLSEVSMINVKHE